MKSLLMSAEMVRGTLDGRNRMFRRPVKPQPEAIRYTDGFECFGHWFIVDGSREWLDIHNENYPSRYRVGDVVFVKETWAVMLPPPIDEWPVDKRRECTIYRATHRRADGDGIRWRPSIHMPEWAARIWLRIDDVRAEQADGRWWWVYTFSRVERPEVK